MNTKFRTYELAKKFYQQCQTIKMRGAMKDQFERATLSIVLNIAEGSGKPSRKDRARFYYIAYGSLKETMALLDLVGSSQLLKKADTLAAHLWKLAQNPGGP